eukprot:m.33931 g.33931  ORF g.33931 m.33931 type:complete len:186 (+) comp16900_c0_seq1:103-660(+)
MSIVMQYIKTVWTETSDKSESFGLFPPHLSSKNKQAKYQKPTTTTTPTKLRTTMVRGAQPTKSYPTSPAKPPSSSTTSTSLTPTSLPTTSRPSPLKVTTSALTQDRPKSGIGHTATTTTATTTATTTIHETTKPPPGSPQRRQTVANDATASPEGVNRTHFVAWKLSQHPQPEVNETSIDNSYEV